MGYKYHPQLRHVTLSFESNYTVGKESMMTESEWITRLDFNSNRIKHLLTYLLIPREDPRVSVEWITRLDFNSSRIKHLLTYLLIPREDPRVSVEVLLVRNTVVLPSDLSYFSVGQI